MADSLFVPRLGDALAKHSSSEGFPDLTRTLRAACMSRHAALAASARQLTEAVLWGIRRRQLNVRAGLEALGGPLGVPDLLDLSLDNWKR